MSTTSTIDLTVRPHYVMDPMINTIVDAMRVDGRHELVHYAGACYYDPVAWQMVIAWHADHAADEPTLKSRALKAAYGWDLTPEQCSLW